jgi:MoxR-like ATPase
MVFLTSNNTREMSEPLKRRCLHLFVPFPEPKLEADILRSRVPELPEQLRTQLVDFIHRVRNLDLKKIPSVSETIDWAKVLVILHASSLKLDLVRDTLNIFLKFEDDIEIVQQHLPELITKAQNSL